MFNKLCRLTGSVDRLKCPRSVAPKQSRDMHCRRIVFKEFGDPAKVAQLVQETLPDKPDGQQVRRHRKRMVTAVIVANGFSGAGENDRRAGQSRRYKHNPGHVSRETGTTQHSRIRRDR